MIFIYTLTVILFFNSNYILGSNEPASAEIVDHVESSSKRIRLTPPELPASQKDSEIPTEIATEEEYEEEKEYWEYPEEMSLSEIIECIESFDYEVFFSQDNKVDRKYLPLIRELFKKTPHNKIYTAGPYHRAQHLLFNDIGGKDKTLISYLYRRR